MLTWDRVRPPQEYLHGWRFGAINCAITATVIFLVNLIITIVCTTYQKKGVLYWGDCNKVEKINSILHWIINLLSTALLSSSNYSMQCLSAPTRKDVDIAHGRGKWLDIGILSVRNLRCINTTRGILWIVLMLSSLPLHLLYNSVVYMSLTSSSYRVHGFVESATVHGLPALQNLTTSNGFERLSVLDCFNAYATEMQTSWGELYLIARDEDAFLPSNVKPIWAGIYILGNGGGIISSPNYLSSHFSWMCENSQGSRCIPDTQKLRENATKGYIAGYQVQYCISKKVQRSCNVYWNTQIAIIVTVLNFLKAVLIYYTAFWTRDKPLMSIGDAVISFLQTPDPTTINMCLVSKHNFAKAKYNFDAGQRRWQSKKYLWKDAPSKTRWILFLLLLILAIAFASYLLCLGIQDLGLSREESLKIFKTLGFAALDPRAVKRYPNIRGVYSYTFLANIPQVIVSLIYFSYNSLFTSMLLAYEWSTYSYKKKGIRVSVKAEGAQRSSYFLSLPYRFALPLMAISSISHWLVSQSVFFVAFFNPDNLGVVDPFVYSFGYSPIAIIITISVGVTILITTIGFGFIPYKPGTNLVGSCSAAISAACHTLPTQKCQGNQLIYKKIQWGVVGKRSDGVGHCSFSDEAVELPQKGEVYAGSRVPGLLSDNRPIGSSPHISANLVSKKEI
ncbi:unnamed protein product [Periconia digitata]|uniref:DUF6536 domain-containing protein n=1 Tax=Periconia digitata TaxID=1303443 RepID=A0A9W4UWF2_9PLEO|nr:unnamed protein product [Periconia digitata]